MGRRQLKRIPADFRKARGEKEDGRSSAATAFLAGAAEECRLLGSLRDLFICVSRYTQIAPEGGQNKLGEQRD